MLKPIGLDHVGLLVTDMDATLRFYQGLGLELLRTSGPNADGVRTAVIRAGSQELNVFSRSGLVKLDTTNALGIEHFCLTMRAASIDALVADLRGAGFEIAKGPIKRRDGTSLFVHDPDGVRVELRLPS